MRWPPPTSCWLLGPTCVLWTARSPRMRSGAAVHIWLPTPCDRLATIGRLRGGMTCFPFSDTARPSKRASAVAFRRAVRPPRRRAQAARLEKLTNAIAQRAHPLVFSDKSAGLRAGRALPVIASTRFRPRSSVGRPPAPRPPAPRPPGPAPAPRPPRASTGASTPRASTGASTPPGQHRRLDPGAPTAGARTAAAPAGYPLACAR
jgi:hypothetical protein